MQGLALEAEEQKWSNFSEVNVHEDNGVNTKNDVF